MSDVYQDMLLKIETDQDLKNNLDVAIARVKNILLNTPSDLAELQNKLSKLFHDNTANLKNKR